MNTDSAYYIDIFNGNWIHRLLFIPGRNSEIDYTDPIRLPANVFIKDLSISTQYENDVPIGLPITDECKLTFELSNIFQEENGRNWDDFRRWIIDGSTYTAAEQTADKSLRVYKNTIIIQHNNGSGTEMKKNLFIGVQDIKPEKEFKMSSKKVLEDITFISIDRAVFEKISWSDFPVGIDVYDKQIVCGQNYNKYKLPDIVEYQYYSTLYYGNPKILSGDNRLYYMENGQKIYASITFLTTIGYKGQSGEKINLRSINRIFDKILEFAETKYRNYLRKSTPNISMNDIFSHIQLFKRGTTQTHATNGAVTGWNSIYYIHSVFDKDNNLIAGYFSDNDKNQTIYKYKSPYDFLKQIAEGLGVKIQRTYNILYGMDLTCSAIFSGTATQSITRGNSKEIQVTLGFNQIQSSKVQISGSVSDTDTIESEYSEDGAELDKSWESNLPLHNHTINYTWSQPNGDYVEMAGNDVRLFKTLPTFTNLLYEGTIKANDNKDISCFLPVHELINIYYNNSQYITDADYLSHPGNLPLYYLIILGLTQAPKTAEIPKSMALDYIKNASTYFSFLNIAVNMQKWINERYKYCSMGLLIGKMIYEKLNCPRQSLVEVTVRGEVAKTNNLGDKYTIDPDDLFTYGMDIGTLNTDAILVNCDYDIIKLESKCKFFISGF